MGIGCWRVGSLSHNRDQERRCKVFRGNALCRLFSSRFWGDNPVVGWVRYGWESVREPDANADCEVMGGGKKRRWECCNATHLE